MTEQTKRRPRADWEALVERWRSSGLSQVAFAERHGLVLGSFRWWIQRLREAGGTPRVARFVAVDVEPGGMLAKASEAATDRVAGVVRVAGGEFLIRHDADPRWVADLLAALARC